jgi:hypothetical protein
MKNIGIISIAALAAAIATPAAAQDVTGTVVIEGSVAEKCLVVPGAGDEFGTTVNLGELAQADGTMRTDLSADFNAASGLTARVVCTTAAPTITVDATAITAQNNTTSDTGYDDSIDFDAHVEVDYVGGSATFSNDSNDAALAETAIGGRLANNGSDNITITADDFHTDAATDLLVADTDYAGSIVVVIAPSA